MLKTERILVKEYSPPPSDSEPDSEALMRHRKREGYPFPEAVALLEKFLKEAEEKIEETHELYSRPGKVLTMEEISALDRKVLGIAAIRRRVGEKMKKLEGDCWKEMKEVLEGGEENDRNEEKLSFLLAIIKTSCDVSTLVDFLKINDFPYKIDSTFENLTSFAKIYAVKQEKAAEIEKEETDRQVARNTVQVSSGGPQANGLLQQKKMSAGHTVSAHLMVLTGKVEKKRLGRRQTKVNGDPEVKKEVKEEEDEEMAEGGGNTAIDQPARVEKKPSKRKGRKNTDKERASGDKMKEKTNEKPAEAIVKEEKADGGYEEGAVLRRSLPKSRLTLMEERSGKEKKKSPAEAIVKEEEVDGGYEEGAMPTKEPTVEEPDDEPSQEAQMNDDGGVNFHGHPKPKRRKLEISEEVDSNELNFCPNADSHHDYDEMNDGLDEMGPPVGDGDLNDDNNRRKEEKRSEARDELVEAEAENGRNGFDFDDTDSPFENKPRKRTNSGKSHAETVKGADESDGDEREKREKFVKPVRWSDRLKKPAKPVTYAMEEDSDDEFSEDEGEEDSASDQEEEEHRESLARSRKISSDGEAQDNGQKDEEVDQSADKNDSADDGNDEKKCLVDGCSEKLSSHQDLVEHMMKHPVPVKCGVCKRPCPDRCSLRRHYRSHTGEKPFKCEICKKSFARNAYLHFHQRFHNGERLFKCGTCQKGFSTSSDLKRHHRVRTGERPYDCDKCDYTTSDPSSLKVHQRIHSGEKPYSCIVCNKRFTRSFTLTRHLRTHTGDRPYKCDKCDYKAAQSWDLHTHKRAHSH